MRLQQWIETEARAARQFASLLERARLVHENQASLLEGGDLARALQWRAEGLLCEPLIPKVESLGGPRTPTESWAARYAPVPAPTGVGAFETVKTLIAQSVAARTSAKRMQVAKVALVSVLILVLGALFWRQTEMRGGMTDLEARELLSMSRAPLANRLQHHEDRALSLVAAARPEVRKRFISRWFNQSGSDAEDVPTPAALRAAVGLDEGLAEQTRAALAAASKAKPVWIRLRVMSAPWLGDKVTVADAVTAILADVSEEETVSETLEATLAAAVEQSKPEELPARLRDVLFALSKRELADEAPGFNAVLRGWSAGLRAHGGAIPTSIYAEMDEVLAPAPKTEAPVLQRLPSASTAARMGGTVENSVVQRVGASMAAPMLRYGQLADEKARRYAAWAWRYRDNPASRPDLVLTALAGAAPQPEPRVKETRRQDAQPRSSPSPLRQAGPSTRLPESPKAEEPMDDRRRQDLLMLYAREVDSQSLTMYARAVDSPSDPEERVYPRNPLRRREASAARTKWHVMTQIAAEVDGLNEREIALRMFSDRRRVHDDDQVKELDRYLKIVLLQMGPQRSADLLRGSKTRGRAFISPWNGDSLERELRDSDDESGTEQDLMLVLALARHLDVEGSIRVGRAFRTALLAAADGAAIERLRTLIDGMLQASNEPARDALGQAIVGAPDRDNPYQVARIASGFDPASFKLLSTDSRAALVAGLSKAWAGAQWSFEFVALAEATAALPPERRAQLLVGGGPR